MLARLHTKTDEQRWREFVKVNCNALFQTALLLTADPKTAELAMTQSIEELDISNSPGQTSLADLKRAVVMRSIEGAQSFSSTADPTIRVVLQPGLRPVIGIERSPRICFVLRMLLGYTTAACAQMLGVEENGVRMLVQRAVILLQQKFGSNTSQI